MSRQDTTILNPMFDIEQTVHAAQTEYIRGFNTLSKRELLTLESVKLAVEKSFGIENLKKNTNARPYPDARKFFVKIAFINVSLDEGEIMDYIGKHRTSFYHNMKQAQNLIDTDKVYKGRYDDAINILGL